MMHASVSRQDNNTKSTFSNNIRSILYRLSNGYNEIFFYPNVNPYIDDLRPLQITPEKFKIGKSQFTSFRKMGYLLKDTDSNNTADRAEISDAWLEFYSYVTRNRDALCWVHNNELEEYVKHNPHLIFETSIGPENTLEYVRDDQRLFIKMYDNLATSEPFFLRIQPGSYCLSRDEFPEMFKNCHTNISKMSMIVRFDTQENIYYISSCLKDNYKDVIVRLSHIVTITKKDDIPTHHAKCLITPAKILSDLISVYNNNSVEITPCNLII